jgi:hypothetical protein
MVPQMTTRHQILRKDTRILLGIAQDNAVLDVLTDEQLIQNCLRLLREPHRGLVCAPLGTFGVYTVRLNLHHDDTVSVFIDGPDFDPCRTQSAAICPRKDDLQQLLLGALEGTSSVQTL